MLKYILGIAIAVATYLGFHGATEDAGTQFSDQPIGEPAQKCPPKSTPEAKPDSLPKEINGLKVSTDQNGRVYLTRPDDKVVIVIDSRLGAPPDFATKTIKHLQTLAGTDTGKLILDSLADDGQKKETLIHYIPAEKNNAFENTYQKDHGTAADVGYNPDLYLDGIDVGTKSRLVGFRPPEQTLGHELIHASHEGHDEEAYHRRLNTREVDDLPVGENNMEESEVIGCQSHEGEEMSENNLAKDLAAKRGKKTYYRRLNHGHDMEEVPVD
jgi:hypothetical protein